MHTLNSSIREILFSLCLILFCYSTSSAQMIQLGRPTDGGGGGETTGCVSLITNVLVVELENTSNLDITIKNAQITTLPYNPYLDDEFEEIEIPAGGKYIMTPKFQSDWGDLLSHWQDIKANYSFLYEYRPSRNSFPRTSFISTSLDYKTCPRANVIPQDSRLSGTINEKEVNISPNPVKDQFTLKYDLEKETAVDIELYNNVGEKVKVLVSNEKQPAGNYAVREKLSSELPSGVYYVLLRTDDEVVTRKLIKL